MSAARGVWLLVLLLVGFGLVAMFAALQLRGGRAIPGAPVVLVFDVPEVLPETPATSLASAIRQTRRGSLTLYEVVSALGRAARDPGVAGLEVRIGDLDWGWGKLAEVRDAIDAFAATGKPVLATLDRGTDAEYYLASAATTIAVPPSAVLQIDGLAMSAVFYGDLLRKVGVSPNFARSGRFKSGIEPYTRSGMSEPSREALEALLDDHYTLYLETLADARGGTVDDMRVLVDEGPYDAEEAYEAGLVDTLLHEADAEDLLDRRTRRGGRAPDHESLRDYARAAGTDGGAEVALVVASGSIVSGDSRSLLGDEDGLGVGTLIDALRDASEAPHVRAIVLRIDSPGGEYQAADDLWREVRRTTDTVPVVVSMSDLAASGGYLIAAPATRIVAQPTTVTGSIGIYGGKFNVEGLYRKLGVSVETVRRGARAGMMSPFRDFTPDEAERFQAQLDRDYRELVAQVAEGRGIAFEAVDSLAQGRVWSGLAAFRNGLVDTLGGIDTAVRLARQEAGLPERATYTLDVYPKVNLPWIERLIASALDESYVLERAMPWSRFPMPSLEGWWNGSPLALLPYVIAVR